MSKATMSNHRSMFVKFKTWAWKSGLWNKRSLKSLDYNGGFFKCNDGSLLTACHAWFHDCEDFEDFMDHCIPDRDDWFLIEKARQSWDAKNK